MSDDTDAGKRPPNAPIPEAASAQADPKAGTSADSSTNQWCMFMHFSLLAGAVIPGAGLILPIVLWQMKKDNPVIDQHGKIVVNWIISLLIYGLVCGILTLIVVGLLGLFALGIMTLIYAIMGGIKANNGEVWNYPASLKLIK